MAKKKTLPAKRRTKKSVHSKSVALVKRAPQAIATPAPKTEATLARVVTDGFALDTIGLVELKTTPEEERVLARDVKDDEVSILPDGAPYLPHPIYTKWLNEAFGRGGWQLVPVSKPALVEHTVVVKYILYVHGKPVALADGQQEYHANNRNQSYGDVLEATRSNALRRCSKHLAIGLQLWDRRWIARWRREHCVQVTVVVRRKDRETGEWSSEETTQWRRKDDEPLKGESRQGKREEPAANKEEHSELDKPISEAKRVRFWRIARRVGRKEDDIKRWLKKHHNYDRTEQITNRNYDKIVRVLESQGDLPNGKEG